MPKPKPTAQAAARVTYYVLQTFSRDKKGVTVDEPIEKRSQGEAMRASARAKDTKVGAIVFSRTGDPISGDWDDAVIHEQWGETPAGFEDMAAA
ncbi:hypothetical protein [Bosea vestrisii]|uniref:Uncharacterized protein n=1 Tax=Bosea vestrisii TaxID=151416 RepID=A0ABW0H9R8_9HYPH